MICPQGLTITAGLIFIYWEAAGNERSQQTTTAMVFVTLVTSNIILTLVNRSFYYDIFTTLKYKNNLVLGVVAVTVFISGFLIYNSTSSHLFKFEPLSLMQLGLSIGVGFLSVIWYELVKWRKRGHDPNGSGFL